MEKKVKIDEHIIGEDHPVFIIAEAGLNHGGDINLAIKMIEKAAESGASAIKFQAFNTDQRFGNDENVKNLVRSSEFNESHFSELMKISKENKILFFATAFDENSLNLLVKLGVKVIKIASCDICNKALIQKVAEKQIPVIISRGTANKEEINIALDIFNKYNCPFTLLHCVSSYPLKDEDANLKAIHNLKRIYNVPIGYSDHTPGITVPLYSVYAGALIIEKHFTLDRELKGIDWELSINPQELKLLVQNIRQAEKILGHGRLEPMAVEVEEINYRNQLRIS